MSLPDRKDNVEDDDGITDVPPVPSHSKAYGLINRLTMVGGICDPVSLQLVRTLQQNTAMKRSTKLTQHCVTSFFG